VPAAQRINHAAAGQPQGTAETVPVLFNIGFSRPFRLRLLAA
jgi:hypothetical protein